jgi:hypothetical protein
VIGTQLRDLTDRVGVHLAIAIAGAIPKRTERLVADAAALMATEELLVGLTLASLGLPEDHVAGHDLVARIGDAMLDWKRDTLSRNSERN